jgi:hypothetical protein
MAWADEFSSLHPAALECHRIVLAALDAAKTGVRIRRNDKLKVPAVRRPSYMPGGTRRSVSIVGQLHELVCESQAAIHEEADPAASSSSSSSSVSTPLDAEALAVGRDRISIETSEMRQCRDAWLPRLTQYREDFRLACQQTEGQEAARASRIAELKAALRLRFNEDATALAAGDIAALLAAAASTGTTVGREKADMCVEYAKCRLAAQIYEINYLQRESDATRKNGDVKTLLCYEICGSYIYANKIRNRRLNNPTTSSGRGDAASFWFLDEELRLFGEA